MSTATLENQSLGEIQPVEVSIHSHAGASFFCNQLISQGFLEIENPRILIAGCGSGHEAIAIQDRLEAEVDAVDVEDFVDPNYKNSPQVRFQVASVCDLPFADQTFDAIFYHHVIEHVNDPAGSILELTRVLKPQGWLFIGTPNRQRLISSIGAHQQSEWNATLWNKVRDNLRDWKDRVTGQFRNECGAHAGFSRRELDAMLSPYYRSRSWLTEDYLRFKYGKSKAAKLLPLVTHSWVSWFAAPSVYVLCKP